MSSLNQVNIIGRVGQDPEVKYLPNGDPVANISVATSERWKDKQSGEQKEKTEWHRVVFFGKLAEIVGEYARKGTLIYCQGKLETREWEKDGIKRYTTEIRAHEMKLLGGKPEGASGQGRDSNTSSSRPAQQSRQAPAQQQAAPQPGADKFDDDVPF